MIFEVKMFYTFGKEQVSIVYVKRRPCWCTEVVHQDGRRIQINQNVQIFIFELLVNKASYWIQNMPVCSFFVCCSRSTLQFSNNDFGANQCSFKL